MHNSNGAPSAPCEKLPPGRRDPSANDPDYGASNLAVRCLSCDTRRPLRPGLEQYDGIEYAGLPVKPAY